MKWVIDCAPSFDKRLSPMLIGCLSCCLLRPQPSAATAAIAAPAYLRFAPCLICALHCAQVYLDKSVCVSCSLWCPQCLCDDSHRLLTLYAHIVCTR